ncbi:MAG TPA: amino acid adenylation domain-containing protein [Nostocaceae cyanobacterium]|nr:amino acid adenylation domain-containing protein [Nostocaceae cyanobacterium]
MNSPEINDLELLELLLEAEGIQTEENQFSILRRNLTEAPLSSQQRRLWFLYELEPTSSAYNICSIFSLRGKLQIEALQTAFKQLQQRHESLRTTFTVINGEPKQRIHPQPLTELTIENFQSLAETNQIIAEISKSEAEYAFDLQTGSLMRGRLLQIAPEEYILTLTLHHIIADAWSVGVIFQEVITLYQIAVKEENITLPELEIQYTDYAVWQQEKYSNTVLENSLNYWENKLSELPTLQFPLDFPRPRLQTFRGDLVKFSLPNSLTKAVRALSQQEGTTLFMTLMAAFQALLSRYTVQEDIPVGTSIANRPGMEAEKLIGFFVNMLVIRTDLTEKPSFRELLQKVRGTILEAFEHTEVPFETLVERLDVERDTSRNPLFQIAFTVLNAPKPQLNLDDLEITILANQEAARFDLELFITETEDNLNGVLSYNIDLLKRETAERFTRHFCQFLENLVAQPDTPVSQLPILTTAEYQQLIASTSPQNFSVEYCLHEVFSQQAKLRPHRTALVFEQERLTYQELDTKANQLAHYLIELGIKPESRVGLWVSRSVDLIVAILGILKAGGVYVPFDPDYPSDRVAYMMEDSQVAVLVTQSQFTNQIPPHQASTVFIDQLTSELAALPTTNPEIKVQPDNAAYIIYTSGSTGKPKGVVVAHRHVVRLMLATEKWFKFNEKDVWTLFHSYAFDFSVWEIWGAFFFGGRLVIVPYFITRSPEDFYNLLCDDKVTVLNQTPSAFRQLMQAEELICREGELELRYVIFGGEALDITSLEPWFDRHSDDFPLLVNMYGITETTVHVTYRPIRLKDVKQRAGSLIGQPIPDLSLYILDRNYQPVPIGVVGEIYVGGAGVTRGYFNRPQLTAERMIPNPFHGEKLGLNRLYKTGDLGRYLANGEIEYIGRNDHQVKIRGFRIELGEIEAVIKRHSGVRDALVIVRQESEEDARIVAYVIPQAKNFNNENLKQEQTAEWQFTFNETYRSGETETNENFNISGWNSSYDNQPIPSAQMRQWLNNTLARIKALKPQRVLELGCGTGMILLDIAPQVATYWGSDFSQEAISRLERITAQRSLNNVRLLLREAADFSHIPPAYFDTIIINSVAQYFPSIDYLQQVITGAMQALAPGGSLFIGDNRNLPLLNYFHSSIAFFQAEENTVKTDLKTQYQRLVETEAELVIDPQFFVNLTQSFPNLSTVEIHLKAENNHNELTKYRYDVVLHKAGGENSATLQPVWQDWSENLQLGDLQQKILDAGVIGWKGIPNQRLLADDVIWQWLEGENNELNNELNTVGEVRTFMANNPQQIGVNPADLYTLAEEIGYQVTISYSPDLNPYYFDVCFYPTNPNNKRISPVMPIMGKGEIVNNQPAWIDPLKSRFTKTLVSQLKEAAREKLPEYMRPSAFVLLDNFPMTPSGKLDRRALPAPETNLTITTQSFVQPTNFTQERLCRIWSDVLGLERISITDDFFQLGGHSLLATKLVSRIREEFNIAFPLRAIFESSTIIGLAEELDRLMGEIQVENATIDIIPQVTARQYLPLSFAQSRLWFLDCLEPNNPAYNMAFAYRVEGNLQQRELEQSFQEIINRHEILRTSFVNQDGSPVQLIHDFVPVPLTVTDLSNLTTEHQERELKTAVQGEIITPFNLQSVPLLRIHLYKLAAETHVIVLVMHHIISDGWSQGIMIKELSSIYTALCQGQASPLAPLSLQYGDFAHWQQTIFTQTQLPQQLAYWKEKLGRKTTVLELPTDFPRPATPSYQGATVIFKIDREIGDRFKKFCDSHGTTLFMGFLAVFSTLLQRYSGQEDLLIGTPIANRNRKQIEDLIGFFVNTLVIHADLAGNPEFTTLLGRIKEETLEAFAHQDVPFEKIVEEIQPDRNLNQNPLFQVMFILQNAPMGKLELPDLTFTPLEMEQVTAKFDLSLSIIEAEQEIIGLWEYRTDLFTAETINRMVGHFQTLLTNILANPQQNLAQIPILTVKEQQQLLTQLNHNPVEFNQAKLVHQLIELQAEKTPDAIAVVWEDEHLTYRELNQKSNQLAHYLQSLGVKPDVLVGICVERSLEMIIGLLAVLKAGGAYVPIDPNYPQERIKFMLNDTKVSVLLTQQKLIPQLDIPSQIQTICLDTDREIIGQYSQENPISRVRGNNLAYMIYTSGSTGKPKGVMIEHYSFLNFTQATIHEYQITESDRILEFFSISFDAAVESIYPCLVQGATLVLRTDEILTSIPKFIEKCHQWSITISSLTTAFWHQLAAELNKWNLTLPPSLRLVIFGGEQALLDKVTAWQQQIKTDVKLINNYGPTETTVVATNCSLITKKLTSSVPIGQPIPNMEVYILDPYLQPVPVGVAGELYISGAGVARGYFRRPDLTAEKFVPHPFSQKIGARLYKTGDLVRYLNDGNIEYLGRIDNQVKIRGFRVEIGEIEAILGEHPEILSTAIITNIDASGSKQLIAFVVPKSQPAPSPNTLREFLKAKLPNYMIPAHFVTLPNLPLTPNGKIDRKALAALKIEQNTNLTKCIPPRTPLENKLVKIWEEMLQIKPVGVTDNFFDLGGHSLLAIKLITAIEKQLQLNLPVVTLFRQGTIEKIAAVLEQKSLPSDTDLLIPLQTQGDLPPLFLIHQAGGYALAYSKLAELLGTERPIYGIQAPGIDGKQPPVNSIEELASRYLKIIADVVPNGAYLLGGHSLGGQIAFEMAAQLESVNQQVEHLLIIDTHPPLPTTQEDTEALNDDAAILSFIVEQVGIHFNENIQISPQELAEVNQDEKFAYVLKVLRQHQIIPPDAGENLISGLLNVYKASLQATLAYQPKPIKSEISLFTTDSLAAQFPDDVTLGWQNLTNGEVKTFSIPGEHQTLLKLPHVEQLAGIIKEVIQE